MDPANAGPAGQPRSAAAFAMARKSRAYAVSAAPMEFDEDDRKVAQEAKVKNTKTH